MSIVIAVDGVNYNAPSSAADTNWAADQVRLEQAIVAYCDSTATDLLELTAAVEHPSWVGILTAALLNNWETAATCARSKSAAGVVTLQMSVNNGVNNMSCLLLPTGWRPPTALSFVASEISGGLPAQIKIGTDGNVTINAVGAGDPSTGVCIALSFSTTVT